MESEPEADVGVDRRVVVGDGVAGRGEPEFVREPEGGDELNVGDTPAATLGPERAEEVVIGREGCQDAPEPA